MRLKREKSAKGSMAAGLAVLILLAGCSAEAGRNGAGYPQIPAPIAVRLRQ
ncbi:MULTISPECIES: hypothetical protein [unclassified Paenibacillus]|uniref:hypothetical protein n=1 Tax=unclassified Paenibacillus TaxID=185978 RepID=UPI000955461F|nr:MULTISPECIES: hypothetical protein [unclassified Paenibacillus]QID16051.1 hypothetical protein CIC07_25305 [Paenibacillus sp. RUD330]SIR15159.1 hypothetical protein SAMN05880555_3147 [Paenibacillus sp. RU4X]SIR22766.1 hypothetical protein SAMN05880570_2850 [Paenibacillus sp. RU4T]